MLCQAVLVILVAAILAVYYSTSTFEQAQCPNPADIQTEYVKAHFDIQKFQGVWWVNTQNKTFTDKLLNAIILF